ncbi:MAG TPA: hypothetical protein PLO67_08350 [Saprospiraceae bacterium]|nr:hypothetical protein [Saprospiraceae bacterium]HPI08949.1 hypothetical protein [Saprospiraceae bacterium]
MDARLLKLFKKLPAADRRRLCEWTQCSLFNKRPEVAALCAHITQHAAHPDSMRAERLHEAAFPGQVYQAARLRHTISYLLQAVRGYLAWSEWNATSDSAPWLLQSLRKRGLDFMFPYEEERAMKALEAEPLRDAGFHYLRYRLLQEKLEMASRSERSARLSLQPLPDALTAFYLSDMLRLACVALTHQAVAGQAYHFAVLDRILDSEDKENLLAEPAVGIYFHAYQMLKNGGEEGETSFQHLKELLARHAEIFAATEMRGLYLMAINGCIRRMNAGQRTYVREAFELYRAALTRGFLLEDGWMSGFTYKNIIRIGAVLGEEPWTRDFLQQYREALHPRDRDNLYKYNLAYLHLQKQDYAQAMPLLQQINFDDALHQLEARRMLLRSYFELGEWEALDSLLTSFGAYLRRQKGLGYHRTTNEKLLSFVKKLVELPSGTTARQKLRTEIENTPDVAERQWLLERCAG